MPLYFFHTFGSTDFRDMHGTELIDFSKAQSEAVKLAGQLMVDDPREFWGDGGWLLDVTDANGLTLFMLQIHATLSPAIGPGLGRSG